MSKLSWSSAPQRNLNLKQERNANFIGKRIQQFRIDRNMTLREISQRLEYVGIQITIAGVHRWEKGETVPNIYQMLGLCHVLDIELQEFSLEESPLNTEGAKRLSEYRDLLIASGLYAPPIPFSDPDRIFDVDPYSYAAGRGTYLQDAAEIPRAALSNDVDLRGHPAFLALVRGNSMEPTFKDGNWVLVNREMTSPGEIGVFVYNNQQYIKELHFSSADDSDAAPYSLVSHNPEYDPIPIWNPDSFQCKGTVLRIVPSSDMKLLD